MFFVAPFSTAIILPAVTGSSARAQKKYDTGATDTDINGNIIPYSGPTERSKVGWRDWIIFVAFVFVLVTAGLILAHHKAAARDVDGRYANSPLKGWFQILRSPKGPCCLDADGTALSDADWEAKDGHYRVRIKGQWWDVLDDAVVKEPNRAGRTMVWPT